MKEKTILTIIEDNWFGEDHWKITSVFEEDESLTIYKIHRLMKQACISMGYSSELVEEAFGETVYDD